MTTINIKDVVFDGSIYPRERPSSSTVEEYADALASGAKFPPIVLEAGTNRLLDGYHRWKAHNRLFEQPGLLNGNHNGTFEEIDAEYHEIPEGVTPRLYAYSLSSSHGLRPSKAEAQSAAVDQYTQRPGTPIEVMCRLLGVSRPTVDKYIKHLVLKFEEDRRSIVMRLARLGWTQEEIAGKLQALWPDAKGTTQRSVATFLEEIEKFQFLLKTEIDKGHAPADIAKRNDLPVLLAWAIALDGLDDAHRMDKLGINVQPYDVWHFAKCHDLFGSQHPGRIPGELLAHVLYFFTEPGAKVIDPMAGSGTTLDVCLAMGRECYGYDIDDRHGRPDVIPHNMSDGWPERVKKADLIFWDPPYYKKMDSLNIGEDGYIDGSISKMGRDEYLRFFANRLVDAKQLVKKGTRLAFLMSDYDDDGGSIFLWDYADILRKAGWTLTRHIQIPLSTQQVHPDIVTKFRKSRRLARLERYLLIAEA